ncbi:MAG: hypothetical protein JOY81_01175 [Alphaproteobacteria bacterium]|nr:hypothetical protein [Alphaproteobacteria bacterium]
MYHQLHTMLAASRTVLREYPFWIAAAICAVSRIAAHYAWDVSYNAAPTIYQLLDDAALRAAPFESLFYSHSQPPLYNALYALSLALPRPAGALLLQLLSILATFAMMAVIYVYLRDFRFRPWMAGLAITIFSLLPQVWGYEHVFFYAQFEAVLVLGAMLFATDYMREGRSFGALAFCLVLLGLTRSLFHLGWILLVLLLLAILRSRRHGMDRRALLVTLVAVAAVGSVYVKNLVVFSTFSSSSWLGASLAEMSIPREEDRARFPRIVEDFKRRMEAGQFSQSTKLMEAKGYVWTGWLAAAKDCAPGTPQPRILCELYKSNGGANLNHISVLAYSGDLGRDGWRTLELYPVLYAHKVALAMGLFLTMPSWDFFLALPSLGRYGEVATLLFGSTETASGSRWNPAHYPSMSVLCAALVLLAIMIIFYRGTEELFGYWSGKIDHADWIFPAAVTLLFILVPNLVNGLETQRMRYTIEPIMMLAQLHELARIVLYRSRKATAR